MKIEIGYVGGKGILHFEGTDGEGMSIVMSIKAETIAMLDKATHHIPNGTVVTFIWGGDVEVDIPYKDMTEKWLTALDGESKPVSLEGVRQ
jgi:hypothetical protein